MGQRMKNMQNAWDNIPPVTTDATASSTYVDKVIEPKKLIDASIVKKLSSSIKKIDQDKYDEAMSEYRGVNPGKKDAIKSGRLYPHIVDMDDEKLTTALINRDYKQK